MSTPERTYTIISRVHVNTYDPRIAQVVPGWELKAVWGKTGTVLPVFVADQYYSAETVDAAIRAAGAQDEEIHSLGG